MYKYKEYTKEMGDEICIEIATSSHGLKKLCELNKHWPRPKDIWLWRIHIEGFGSQYARAKQCQMDVLAEDALDIAKDGSNDAYINDGKRVVDHENIQRSRLIVDTIKWQTSKLAPKLYGDKIHDEDSTKKLDELKSEMQSLKEIASKCLKDL